MEHDDSDTKCTLRAWNGCKRLVRKSLGIGNQRKTQDHPDYSIKIGRNTEKSSEETCCHSDYSKVPPANASGKKLPIIIIIIIIYFFESFNFLPDTP